MTSIPDFNKNELWVVHDTLKQRYGEPVEPEQAETEMRLDSHSTALAVCPALYWQHNDCNFLVVKTAEDQYRCQFFYRVHQQYGTGVEIYTDLSECIVSLLQVQADNEALRREAQEKEQNT